MVNRISSPPRFRLAVLRACFALALTLGVLIANTRAQGSAEGMTPPALTPGTPAGSYALSGFESVNLFNGNLNFYLPLLGVGGRGKAQVPMMLNIQQRWRVIGSPVCSPCGPVYVPTYNWWTGYKPGYGPGVMEGRASESGEQQDHSGAVWPQTTLTRFTFTAADGTEYELRDALSDGAPQPVDAGGFTPVFFNRGATFITADGASATFVSCLPDGTLVPITDGDSVAAPIYPSGLLMLRDGTRYRIDGGLVSWMQDRNGNRITFNYDHLDQWGNPDGRVTRIVDSLNREITVAYDVNAGFPYGVCDEITFPGFGGIPRKLRISKDLLSTALRAGFAIRTSHDLFPGLSGSSSTPFDVTVTTAVWLPDGRSYKFYYNDYGELSRVVLPTGGAIEYDWGPGINNSDIGGVAGLEIYRRVLERRIYPDGGSGVAFESKQTYSVPETWTGAGPPTTVGYVDSKQYDSGLNLLAASRHYFFGVASNFSNPVGGVGIDYSPWDTGKEYKTEALDSDGVTVLQRVEHTFDQQPPVWWAVWGNPWVFPPSNNPRLTQSVTTWVQTNQVAKQRFFYDIYNNRTAVEEFDYGVASSPANPTRRTETDYVTISEVNDIDYTGANIGSNMNLPYLRSLPQEQRVYSVSAGGGQTLAAKTHFYYDQFALAQRPGIVGLNPVATAARGNLTSTSRWLDTSGAWITTTLKYDVAGSVVESTDGRGNTSLVSYASSFDTYAFPTSMSTPVPDPTGQSGSSSRLVSQYNFDFSSGLLKTITDPNLQITTASYNDALDRLTGVTMPPGGGQVTYVYGDTPGNLFFRTLRTQDATTTLESTQYFDNLGRITRSSKSEGATSIFVDTQYDALGRISQVSNPYRLGDALQWTVTQYDALGRAVRVTLPGGAQVTTTYLGNNATSADPAGKTKATTTDALGRLIQVIEDPGSAPHLNYQTSYMYDALDNLRKVTQGSQARYFIYDSLKRLIRAKESGAGRQPQPAALD